MEASLGRWTAGSVATLSAPWRVILPGPLWWPDFGRTTLQKKERQREPMSTIVAGQLPSAQVAGTRGTVYGPEGWGFESLPARC